MADNVYFVPGDGTDEVYPEATPHPVMTDANDSLTAGSGDDVISTGDGEDSVNGGGGDDIIVGRLYTEARGAEIIDTDGVDGDAYAVSGGDILYGGDGNDVIYAGYDTNANGGAGIDTAHVSLYGMWTHWVAHTILYTFNDEALDVDLQLAATGSVVLNVGGLGDLTVTLVNMEIFDITFGDGDDRVFGGAWGDRLDGSWGSDELHGRDGEDALLGQSGADALFGDGGDDFSRRRGSRHGRFRRLDRGPAPWRQRRRRAHRRAWRFLRRRRRRGRGGYQPDHLYLQLYAGSRCHDERRGL